MPDLTLETTQVCQQLEPYKHYWHIRDYDQYLDHTYMLNCTCKGFQVRRTCKHVRELEETRCTWHGMYDEAQTTDKVCPRCGGPTMYVRVAV